MHGATTEPNTLTFYFIFHWPSPRAGNQRKSASFVCLSVNAGVSHWHPDPHRSKQSGIWLKLQLWPPQVRLLRGIRRKTVKTQTNIPAEE